MTSRLSHALFLTAGPMLVILLVLMPSAEAADEASQPARQVFDLGDACSSDGEKLSESMELLEAAAGSGSEFEFEFKPNAEELLKKAIATDPKNLLAYDRLGHLYMFVKSDTQAAIKLFKQALVELPGCASVHANLGIAYSLAGRYGDAQEQTRAAIRLTPEPPAHYYFNLGGHYLQSGSARESVGWYEKALRLDPKYTKAISNLTTAYLQLREVDKLLELQAGNADYLRRIGVSLSREGDERNAVVFYRASLDLEGDADTYYNLAVSHGLLGEKDSAREAAQQSLKLDPYHDGALTVVKKLGE